MSIAVDLNDQTRHPAEIDASRLQFTADVSDAIFRAAYRRLWWHDWPQYAVASAILLPAFTIAWWLGYLPNAAWLPAVAFAVGLSIYFYRDYHRYLRLNLAIREQIGDHRTQFVLCGDVLEATTAAGVSVFNRSQFKRVLEGPAYVILLLEGFNCVIVPTNQLSADERHRLWSWLAALNRT